MARSILQHILDPLGGVQFISVYHQYYPLIDFFLYIILFTGISRVTLEKRFEGVSGRITSLGVGIVLALALAVTEYRMNFNIASFGPLAAIIALSLISLLFFQMLLSFGIPLKVAASIAFIGVYTTIRSFAPSFFDWMLIQAPILAGLLSLALLVSIGIIVVSIIPSVSSASLSRQTLSSYVPEAMPQIRESAMFSDRADRISQQIQWDEQDSYKRLGQIKQYLPTLIRTEEGQRQLIQALQEINLREHAVYQSLKQLQTLDQAIEQGDITTFQKITKEIRSGRIPKESLTKIIQIMQDIRRRIELEKTLASIEARLDALMQQYAQAVSAVSQTILQRDGSGAMRALNSAIRQEQTIKKIMDVIGTLEKKLKSQFMQALKKAGIKPNATKPYPSSASSRPRGR